MCLRWLVNWFQAVTLIRRQALVHVRMANARHLRRANESCPGDSGSIPGRLEMRRDRKSEIGNASWPVLTLLSKRESPGAGAGEMAGGTNVQTYQLGPGTGWGSLRLRNRTWNWNPCVRSQTPLPVRLTCFGQGAVPGIPVPRTLKTGCCHQLGRELFQTQLNSAPITHLYEQRHLDASTTAAAQRDIFPVSLTKGSHAASRNKSSGLTIACHTHICICLSTICASELSFDVCLALDGDIPINNGAPHPADGCL